MLGPDRPVIVAVDPRVTKTAMVADLHVPVRPRGDVALLNGVLVVLLAEGLIDVDAARSQHDGIDDLLDGLVVDGRAGRAGSRHLGRRGGDLARDRAPSACMIASDDGRQPPVQGPRRCRC